MNEIARALIWISTLALIAYIVATVWGVPQ